LLSAIDRAGADLNSGVSSGYSLYLALRLQKPQKIVHGPIFLYSSLHVLSMVLSWTDLFLRAQV
jgi:hypothetical protein